MPSLPTLFTLTALLTLAGCTGEEKPNDTGTPIDSDGDGVFGADDCNDSDPDIYPGAEELCNGVDDDCNELIDDSAEDQLEWMVDQDNDGYGQDSTVQWACTAPSESYVNVGGDCDDNRADVNPGATEWCDGGVDEDCDGLVDLDDDSVSGDATWYRDLDGDGHGDPDVGERSCDSPAGFSALGDDCDDGSDRVHPGHEELCDSLDNDCDGLIDDEDDSVIDPVAWYQDSDGDGYGTSTVTETACEPSSGFVENDADCDDTVAEVGPASTEICDSLDNDCDGVIDEDDAVDATTWYADSDGDGHGDATVSQVSCVAPSGYVDSSDDCDVTAASVSPSADEICNGTDDDCDGNIDESDAIDPSIWYTDADSDGYGDPASPSISCTAPTGSVSDSSDCDDQAAAVNPASVEICDTLDNDCDGVIDESDAADALVGHLDYDGDGFGGQAFTTTSCTLPSGYVVDNTDCDDTNANSNPGASEVCADNADNDCDGTVNEPDAIDVTTWYVDADGDGHGDSAQPQQACEQPTGYALLDGDCNESDSAIHPSATEISGNGIDDNCVNDLPVIQSVTLSPTSATTDTVLTASVVAVDPEGEALVLSYSWAVDGVVQPETTSSLDGITAFDKNQGVYVDVTADDGTDQATLSSDTLVVLNSAPTAPSISIDPPSAAPGTSDLICLVDTASTDADNDTLTYSFSWLVDGVAYDLAEDTADTALYSSGPQTTNWPDDTILAADTAGAVDLTCQVTAEDGTDSSTIATSVFYGCSPGSQVFDAYGSFSFVAPDGCQTYEVKLWGAGGGGTGGHSGCGGGTRLGGGGGFATGEIAVTPGETLEVIVGQGGNQDCGTATVVGGGGLYGGCSRGGGRSAIRRGTTELVTAGGGGSGSIGSTSSSPGGAGGGLTGNNGGSSPQAGRGGTQTAGGTTGTNCRSDIGIGQSGSQFQGGSGYSYGGGAAGGGGYYGGGGGCHINAGGAGVCSLGGGGGGSSYIDGLVPGTGSTTAGSASNPAETSDADYSAPAGVGGTTSSGSAGNGRVVITWSR